MNTVHPLLAAFIFPFRLVTVAKLSRSNQIPRYFQIISLVFFVFWNNYIFTYKQYETTFPANSAYSRLIFNLLGLVLYLLVAHRTKIKNPLSFYFDIYFANKIWEMIFLFLLISAGKLLEYQLGYQDNALFDSTLNTIGKLFDWLLPFLIASFALLKSQSQDNPKLKTPSL